MKQPTASQSGAQLSTGLSTRLFYSLFSKC